MPAVLRAAGQPAVLLDTTNHALSSPCSFDPNYADDEMDEEEEAEDMDAEEEEE